MLVISRRKLERILIGDDIEIVIIDTGHTTVKIGIKAPKSVKVLRSELTAFKEVKEEE